MISMSTPTGASTGVTALCNRVSADKVPIILGEYGQKSQAVDDNLQYWTTADFLYTAKTHCFSAALAWKYETSQAWLTYLKPDGSFRPAYFLIQAYKELPTTNYKLYGQAQSPWNAARMAPCGA